MATKTWRGTRAPRAQVNTVTPANVGIGNTFTLTINSVALTFTATAGTVANVTAGLVALVNASTAPPEFRELTATDNTTTITLTGKTAGKPFTQTSSASGGTATLTTSTTTAAQSPNDVSDSLNWGGSLPTSGDTIVIDGNVSLLYNLSALDGETPDVIDIRASFTGEIGLPDYTGSYYEYRDKDLIFADIKSLLIGLGTGQGSRRMRLRSNNDNDEDTDAQVYLTGQPYPGEYALTLFGTAAGAVNVNRGSVRIAECTLDTVRVGYISNLANDSTVRLDAGNVITAVEQTGGNLNSRCAITTVTKSGGRHVVEEGAITTYKNRGDANSVCVWNSTGTLGTPTASGKAWFDFSQDMRTKTVTNPFECTNKDAVHDPQQVVGNLRLDLNETELTIGERSLGTNVRITRGTPA